MPMNGGYNAFGDRGSTKKFQGGGGKKRDRSRSRSPATRETNVSQGLKISEPIDEHKITDTPWYSNDMLALPKSAPSPINVDASSGISSNSDSANISQKARKRQKKQQSADTVSLSSSEEEEEEMVTIHEETKPPSPLKPRSTSDEIVLLDSDSDSDSDIIVLDSDDDEIQNMKHDREDRMMAEIKRATACNGGLRPKEVSERSER